jgi:hypothetical protein
MRRVVLMYRLTSLPSHMYRTRGESLIRDICASMAAVEGMSWYMCPV